jgi:hypothetical protein
MAEQVGSASAGGVMAGAGSLGGSTGAETAPFVSQVPGTPVHFPSYHGRTVSWVAVSLILVGFIVGGLALVFGPTWWVFWLGCAIAAVGGLLGLATGIQEDWY